MNTKILAIAVVVLIAIISFVYMNSATGQIAAKTMRIGVIAPLSGSLSSWGQSMVEGIEIAKDKINEQGGVNGKKVELVVENDQCLPKEAASAAKKLIDVDNVKVIIGPFCSSATLAAAPIAEESRVVLLSPGSAASQISYAGDYVFRIWPSNRQYGEALADKIYSDGYKNVGAMFVNNDYGKDYYDKFALKFTGLGGTVSAETFEQGSKDFRTQLIKIKNSNPDAIIIIANDEGGLIARQMGEINFTTPIYGHITLVDKNSYTQSNGALEGSIYTSPDIDTDSEQVRLFLTKYKKEPAAVSVALHGYDAMVLIAGAIQKYGYDADRIKYGLYATKNYPGVSGTITIDENGDAVRTVRLMRIVNGTGVPL